MEVQVSGFSLEVRIRWSALRRSQKLTDHKLRRAATAPRLTIVHQNCHDDKNAIQKRHSDFISKIIKKTVTVKYCVAMYCIA